MSVALLVVADVAAPADGTSARVGLPDCGVSHEARRRTALDWMAVAVEEHGREIVDVYLQAMRGGDWRAAEALMSRIYGKPTETVVTHVPPSPALELVRSLSLDEKLELLRRLQGGELADTGSAFPIVEAVPPTAQPNPTPAKRTACAASHARRTALDRTAVAVEEHREILAVMLLDTAASSSGERPRGR
jgi:hypothetical protein